LRLRDNWRLHVAPDLPACLLILPGLSALLYVEVDVIDKALPSVGDDAGVVIVCSMVDQETDIIISCLVGVRIEKL
jgi:hypothetical protein